MEILASIYDKDLVCVGTIENWKSLLRTERFRNPGEFEMKIPSEAGTIAALFLGYFITFSDDASAYLIEDIEPDIDYGPDIAKVSGRDLKALCDTRLVWKLQTVSGTIWNRMYWLLHNNAVSPTAAARKIPYLTDLTLMGSDKGESTARSQYTGDNLLTACTDLLGSGRCGWRMALDIKQKSIASEFYSGADRTDTVIFNDTFGNLSNIKFSRSIRSLGQSVALVAGEGEDVSRTYLTVDTDGHTGNAVDTSGPSGLDRRELYVDARDLQSKTSSNGTETTMSAAEYAALLQARGLEKLAANQASNEIDFETNDSVYTYGEHYELGDLVTVQNHRQIGITAICRVVAAQISDDSDGRVITPTFEVVDMEVIV